MLKLRVLLCLVQFLFTKSFALTFQNDVYETKLNHYDPNDTRTFDLHFSYSADYYKYGGSTLIYIVGGTLTYEEFLGITKGEIEYYARGYKSYVFILEHRYFGESKPTNHFPYMTLEALRYLDLDNILSDITTFAHWVRTSPRFEITDANKIFLLGYGYGGGLAAWAFRRNKHLFDSVWASTPFALMRKEVGRLEKHLVTNSFVDQACLSVWYQNYEELKKVLAANQGRDLPFSDKLCGLAFNKTSKLNWQYVAWRMMQPILDNVDRLQAQPGVRNADLYEEMCATVTENQKNDKFAAINWIIKDKACFDLNYTRWTDYLALEEWFPPLFENGLDAKYFDDVPWFWLQCTQYGWFRTSEKVPFEFFFKMCEDVFYDKKLTPNINNLGRFLSRIDTANKEFQYDGSRAVPGVEYIIFFTCPKLDNFEEINPRGEYCKNTYDMEFGGDFSAYGIDPKFFKEHTGKAGFLMGNGYLPDNFPEILPEPKEIIEPDSEENSAQDGFYIGHIETNTSTSQNPKYGKIRVRFFKARKLNSTDPTSPTFIIVGGPMFLIDYFMYDGPIYDMAKTHGGELYHLEHRFFGQSMPFQTTIPAVSLDMLRNGLSIKQAMDDIARFILQVPDSRSPIILCGYGYGGLLATQVQRSFPDRVVGVWASSAFLKSDLNFNEQYFKSMTNLLTAIPVDSKTLLDVIFHAFALFAISHNRQYIDLYAICNDEYDEIEFFTHLLEMSWWLDDVVAPDKPRPRSTKAELQELAEKFKGIDTYQTWILANDHLKYYFRAFNKESCLKSTILENFNTIENAEDTANGVYVRFSRPWLYLQCKEQFLMYVSFFHDFQFDAKSGRTNTLKVMQKICKAIMKEDLKDANYFNEGFSPRMGDEKLQRVLTYGSKDPYATLMYDTQEREDWQKMEGTTILECKDCGYAEDMFGHPVALETINAVKDLVKKWLNKG